MELILGYSIVTAVIFIIWIVNVVLIYNRNFRDED